MTKPSQRDYENLLEALPWGYNLVLADNGLWYVWPSEDRLFKFPKERPEKEFWGETPAEALASLWLTLKEKNLL